MANGPRLVSGSGLFGPGLASVKAPPPGLERRAALLEALRTRLQGLRPRQGDTPLANMAFLPANLGLTAFREGGLGLLNVLQFIDEGGSLTPADVLSVTPAGAAARAIRPARQLPAIRFARDKVRGGQPISKEFTAIDVDVGKLTAAAKRDKDFFIKTDPSSTKQRKFLEFAAENEVALPVVGLTRGGKNPIVGFEDGRNRFAALRGLGFKTIPIAVDKSQAAVFRRLFAPN